MLLACWKAREQALARFILSRLAQMLLVLLAASLLVFVVVRLTPGDPAAVQLGIHAGDPRLATELQAIRAELGLDKPVPVQYVIWLGRVIRGNFGVSSSSNISVSTII